MGAKLARKKFWRAMHIIVRRRGGKEAGRAVREGLVGGQTPHDPLPTHHP